MYHAVIVRNEIVDFLMPQPICPNKIIILYCNFTIFNFDPNFFEWTNKAFGNFIHISPLMTRPIIRSGNGRFLANLTVTAKYSTGSFKLASTLTISPPLNNVNKITLNNTTVRCAAGDSRSIIVGDALIMLDGEELGMFLIIRRYKTRCLSLHHTGVSPPANLSSTANTSSPSAKIEWDPLQGRIQDWLKGGAKYIARVSAREILCATPTFDVISAHDILYEEKVNK